MQLSTSGLPTTRKQQSQLLQVGLPDVFCKNTGNFVKSDRSRLHL